jgi:hypothetical protein
MFTEGLMVNRTDVLNPDVGLTGGFIAALASFLRLHFSIVFARSENVAAVMIFVTLQQCMVAVDNGGSERRRCKCSGSIDGRGQSCLLVFPLKSLTLSNNLNLYWRKVFVFGPC